MDQTTLLLGDCAVPIGGKALVQQTAPCCIGQILTSNGDDYATNHPTFRAKSRSDCDRRVLCHDSYSISHHEKQSLMAFTHRLSYYEEARERASPPQMATLQTSERCQNSAYRIENYTKASINKSSVRRRSTGDRCVEICITSSAV